MTLGYVGGMDAGGRVPIADPYYKQGLCPVNVHWHLGAEHLSVGEYDEAGKGPSQADEPHRKLLAEGAREGLLCHHYDDHEAMFTTEYDWKHCVDMHVGQTYEVRNKYTYAHSARAYT